MSLGPDLPLATQVGSVARAALAGRTAAGIVVSLALLILAGVVAPGDAPGWWTWLRVLIVWLLATGALIAFAERRRLPISTVVPWATLAIAILVSLTFTVLTAAFTLLILVVLLLTLQPGEPAQPPVFWAVASTLTPLWVWSAFDAWDPWLLMLVPIGVIGVVALEHALRSGLSRDDRPELVAAWIGVVALAAILLAAALIASIDTTWLVAGGIGVALLAGVDVALVPASLRDRLPAPVLPAIGLVALTFAWLAAL